MITYLLYLGLFLVLIVLQTTILSGFLALSDFYNLLTPVVVYLGLYRPMTEGAAMTVFAGILMDSMSGTPFGLYTTIYIWLFAGIKWVVRYFHAGSFFVAPIVSGAAVLLENFIVLSIASLVDNLYLINGANMRAVGVKTLWAMLTIPFFLIGMNYLQSILDRKLEEMTLSRNG